MYTDVEWIFRSGNAERREAMQRIVDRSDAKPERKRRPQMCVFLVEISITQALQPRREKAKTRNQGPRMALSLIAV
jgi:hypothetical protein